MTDGTAEQIDISVVVPVRDEEQSIGELIQRLTETLDAMQLTWELIFVTDVNRDGTVDALHAAHKMEPRVKMLRLSDSYGQHIAAIAGIHATGGDCVVLMDGDLQDYPEDIPKLYDRLRQGYDVVYGVKERKNDSMVRNLLSRSFNMVLNFLSDRRLRHNSCMFRIMSRRTVEQLRRFRECDQTVTGLVALVNYPTDQVLVTSGQREAGETKYPLSRQIHLAMSLILSFSTKPLRLISLLGIALSGTSFIYLIVTLVQSLLGGIPVQGWATIVSLLTLLCGVQLLAIGVIGEYVGRIYVEVKNRPLYVVSERLGNLSQPSPTS